MRRDTSKLVTAGLANEGGTSLKLIASHRQSRTSTASALYPKLVRGVLTAVAFASTMPSAYSETLSFKFQNITNANDPTFNQELGINNAGVIAGYFGSGAAGHPNKGYTVVRSYNTQLDFTNENFPGSKQTQAIGINNTGFDLRVFRGTTVGFWSDMNNANLINNNFGFVNIGGQNGTFINVNNPNTGTINGVKTNQLLGVNDFNIAVGLYVDTAGATHVIFTILQRTFSPPTLMIRTASVPQR
jgi:hypothetical protein